MKFHVWRYRQFHSSIVLGWICIGLLIGLALGQNAGIVTRWWVIVPLCVVIVVAFTRPRWYAIVIASLCAVVLGMVRGHDVDMSLQSTRDLVGHEVTIAGVIAEDAQISPRGDTRVVLGNLHDTPRQYNGEIWLSINGEKSYERGDQLVVRAKLKDGFGSYQASATFATVLEHHASRDPMLGLRDAFSRSIKHAIVEPSASLGIGFVVGQKTSLPAQLDEQLRIVGLTHLVVASGYNLTILVRFAKRLFEKRSKYMVAFMSAILIVGFIAISGASPSMVRAGIVAGLSVLAWYYGRRFHPLLLILYVAALTAMIRPTYLWSDVGWWLSFLAFFGVLIISPLVIRAIMRDHEVPALVQIVFETVAAQIMTLPLILMVFGNLPVLALIANVLSAPLIPLAMLLTFIAGVGTMLAPALGAIIALPAEILLSYFVAVIRTLSRPEWAQVAVSITPAVMVAMYAAVVVGAGTLWHHLRYNFRQQSLIE